MRAGSTLCGDADEMGLNKLPSTMCVQLLAVNLIFSSLKKRVMIAGLETVALTLKA